MNAWSPENPPKYPATRPDRPSDPRLLDAPEFVEEGEGLELDLMRRSYVNISYELAELAAVVAHVRTSNAPFTAKDLGRLEKAMDIMLGGMKMVKKSIRVERRWSIDGSLTSE